MHHHPAGDKSLEALWRPAVMLAATEALGGRSLAGQLVAPAAGMAHSDSHSQQEAAVHDGFEGTSAEAGGAADDRKLVVLGLPWVTDEASLRKYFSQFGPLQECVVMKDRATGKSRGFGFVTFWNAADAQRVLEGSHVVDGRRCEPKMALPRGGPPQRSSRIFVARIPSTVTDEQFRQYFESFGAVQDAYMPKDPSKQAHRGIGFIAFTSPESVDVVMAVPHSLHGVELAIDSATPKEGRVGFEAARQASSGSLLAHALGASSVRPLQQFMAAFPPAGGFAAPASVSPPAAYPNYSQGRAHPGLSYSGAVGGGGYEAASNGGAAHASGASGASPYASASSNGGRVANGGSAYSSGSGGGRFESGGSEAGNAVSGGYGAAMGGRQSLEDVSPPSAGERHSDVGLSALQDYLRDSPANDRTAQALQGLTFGGGGEGIGLRIGGLLQAQAQYGGGVAQGAASNGAQLSALDEHLALLQRAAAAQAAAAARPPPAHGHTHSDRLSGEGGRFAGGGPADARAGPRIFVGKLNKETTEGDVREYFTRFGYVMDVYMPRDKINRAEHRGFGFVTFETEAAVARVNAHGQHQIRGSTVAIDCAVPRREEDVAPGHSQASITRGLPSIPSIASLHASPGHAFADVSQGFCDVQGMDLGAADDLNAGPARHCLQERVRHGYRPY
ncbi:hypothetical protein WJX81_002984 [Elliptochloris bilobata]|uniref:RRM domain-containing protein n=1 Tax=Elliptochloris bilobata TaxID=381761 RepID=A0AAW1R0X0_9CHLO